MFKDCPLWHKTAAKRKLKFPWCIWHIYNGCHNLHVSHHCHSFTSFIWMVSCSWSKPVYWPGPIRKSLVDFMFAVLPLQLKKRFAPMASSRKHPCHSVTVLPDSNMILPVLSNKREVFCWWSLRCSKTLH